MAGTDKSTELWLTHQNTYTYVGHYKLVRKIIIKKFLQCGDWRRVPMVGTCQSTQKFSLKIKISRKIFFFTIFYLSASDFILISLLFYPCFSYFNLFLCFCLHFDYNYDHDCFEFAATLILNTQLYLQANVALYASRGSSFQQQNVAKNKTLKTMKTAIVLGNQWI